jgi:hypothetical protein
MFKPTCPHCHKQVALLEAAWQSQRNSKQRICPHCKGSVTVQFKTSIYALWLLAFLAASAVGGFIFGAYGFAIPFLLAFITPLVPSIYLAAV